jgi:hypothetical protein
VALHALALALIFLPVVATTAIRVDPRSLGQPTDARRGGGGGGGGGGSGAIIPERLRYLLVTPMVAPTPAIPPPRPAVPQRIARPVAPPVAAPEPTPRAPPPEPTTGAAGGGADLTGAGTGVGGGVGTGTGSGVGNGVGNGTGGSATATKVKAYPIELPAAGLDAPAKIRPFHLEARFEVTDRGDARLLSFTPTRDDGFNKRLREELSGTRFHAAALPDGTPVADTVAVTLDLQ